MPALAREGTAAAIRQQLGRPLSDVRAAFADYVAHDNHGRPFVIIAHSRGAILMRRVIASLVDRRPTVRRRMPSPILLGANVLVRSGLDVGGDFRHIPGCRPFVSNGADLHAKR